MGVTITSTVLNASRWKNMALLLQKTRNNEVNIRGKEEEEEGMATLDNE